MPKREHLIIITTSLIAIAVALVFFRSASGTPTNTNVWRTDAFIKGSPDAKVKIVEFGDFACPTCKAMAQVLDKLLTLYSTDLVIQWRYFPLPEHKNAGAAALASLYTTSADQFWNMHNLLFNTLETWSTSADPKESFKQMLVLVGGDADGFAMGSQDAKFNTMIDKDFQFAENQELSGTPSFYINGQLYEGELSEMGLKQVIEEEMKK